MILLDTNIIIYLANGTLNLNTISKIDIAHSPITKIEALGYPGIQAQELVILKTIFEESYNLPITNEIIDMAIVIKQSKKTSLGDAIIGATAIVNDVVLWTANIDYFKDIDNLKIINPLIK